MNAPARIAGSRLAWMIERRRNHLGRWVVWMHTHYCPPRLVPFLWGVVVLLGFLQLLFVTFW